MIMLTCCLVLAGCLLLALSQPRNWRAVSDVPPQDQVRTALRISGWLLLAVAMAAIIAAEGAGFGVLIWTLQVAVASFLVAMGLSCRGRTEGPEGSGGAQ